MGTREAFSTLPWCSTEYADAPVFVVFIHVVAQGDLGLVQDSTAQYLPRILADTHMGLRRAHPVPRSSDFSAPCRERFAVFP